ncbi:MAG: ribbon-helix-helix protein, CopG family [Candidatus Bathyarchaeia archaeon]
MGKRIISIRLDDKLVEILKKDARIKGITFSDLVRIIIEIYYLLYVTGKLENVKDIIREFEEHCLNNRNRTS